MPPGGKLALRRLAIVALSGALSFPASAAHWYRLGQETGGAVWYEDSDSFRSSGPIRYVWVRIEESRSSKARVRMTKMREKIDCDAHTIRVLDRIRYGANQRVLSTASEEDYSSDVGMEGIVPDSMGETLADSVCVTIEPPPEVTTTNR